MAITVDPGAAWPVSSRPDRSFGGRALGKGAAIRQLQEDILEVAPLSSHCLELCARSHGYDSAPVDDGNPIADLLGHTQRMSGKEDGFSRSGQPPEQEL